jgi:hypothetical protein
VAGSAGPPPMTSGVQAQAALLKNSWLSYTSTVQVSTQLIEHAQVTSRHCSSSPRCSAFRLSLGLLSFDTVSALFPLTVGDGGEYARGDENEYFYVFIIISFKSFIRPSAVLPL